jgi:hypothetical protein
MPEIMKDDAFAQSVLDKIVQKYLTQESRSGAWHVSDLMYPRYAIFSRITNHKPERDAIGFFFTGEAYHHFLQGVLGDANSEVRKEVHGVLGTADYFDGDTLLEIKTSRKWTIPEDPQDNYIEQAGYYCAIFDKPSAKVLVIFPTAGRKWDGSASSTVEVVCWEVRFSGQEREKILTSIKEESDALDKAWKSKSPFDIKALRSCPGWKYGTVERDAEKKEYYVNVRCPFTAMCPHEECSREINEECARKNANRRVFPKGEGKGGSVAAGRYAK